MIHRLMEQLGDILLLAVISLAVGVIKILSIPEPRDWKYRLGTLLISVFVGTLAGAMALQYNFGDYTALTISSIASLLSRDIVMGILNNRKNIGALIKRAAFNLVDKFTGGNSCNDWNDKGHGKEL